MKVIDGLSEYSKKALMSIVLCKKIQIKGAKNENIEVARKIAKVKRTGKFEETH